MEPLKNLVEQQFGQKKIYQHAQASLVIAEANKLLSTMLPQVSDGVRAIYLKDQILTLAVLDNDWLSQLLRIKTEFIQRLNQKFSTQTVKDWHFLT